MTAKQQKPHASSESSQRSVSRTNRVSECEQASIPIALLEARLSRLNRTYALLSDVNQTIVRVRESQPLYEAVCRIAVEKGGFRMAWIGLLDPQTKQVKPVAHAGETDGYLERLHITLDDRERGGGPTGAALCAGKHVVVNDIANDPRMAPWREDALRLGYRASIALPLVAFGQVHGTLNLYASEPDFFDEDELRLLDETAADISFAMEFIEREKERERFEIGLRESEEKYRLIADNADDWVYLVAPDGRIRYSSPSCERVTGYSPAEFIDHPDLLGEITHPEDGAQLKNHAEMMREQNRHDDLEFRIVTKTGEVRWISHTCSLTYDREGVYAGRRGTNRNITRRKVAEEQVRAHAERQGILADASQAFAAVGQDYRAVLDEVVRKVTETLADVCQIRILSDNGSSLEVAAIYSVEPEVAESLRALEHPTTTWSDDPGVAPHVLRTGEPVFIPIIAPDQLRALLPPESRPIYERFAPHSYIVVPLRVRGSNIGVLALTRYRCGQPPFTKEDLDLAQDLGGRAALAISNARLFGQAQDELAERKRAEQALSETETRYRSLLEAAPIGIAVHSDGRIVYVNPAGARLLGGESEEQIVGMSISDIIHPDGLKVAQTRIQRMLAGEKGLYPTEDTYVRLDGTPVDVEVMASALNFKGKPAVQVIVTDITERKKAEETIEKQLRRMSALRSIDLAIASTVDLRVALNILLDHVTTQLNMDAALVLLLNRDLNRLEYAAGRGFRGTDITRLRLKVGEGFAGQAALTRRTVAVPNLPESEYAPSTAGLIASEHLTALWAVPLISKGQVKGVLEVFQRSRFEPNPDWLDFLEALAGQAAIAIDNAQMFDGLQRSNTELALAYDATIEGWSRAMDLRDKETEGHSQRVTELTVELARHAGMTAAELTHVRHGALLHDLGKLGVPDNVLLKPGKLTDEEWVAMRKHPQYAYDMLSSVQYLRPALDIPRCHHEKWDGTGYPQGLKGEAIPLAARLFAVVDVWDALRSDRPYRPGWPQEKALEYIRQQSGSHFDPKAVDLFFQVIREREDQAMQSPGAPLDPA